MIVSDTAISYGGMRKNKDARRVFKINDECLFAASGEMADFQNLKKMVEDKREEDEIENDGATFLKPRDYFNFISHTNYNKRMKMDPLYTATMVAGVRKDNKEVFLGMTDLYGTKVEADFLLSGLALYYCQAVMQNGHRPDMTE